MKILHTIENALNAIGLTGASLIIGMIGSLIAQVRTQRKPWWQFIIFWLSGGFGAAFLGPLVAHWLHLDNEQLKSGAIFFVGLFAHDLSQFVVSTIQFFSKNQELLLQLKNRFKR